MKIRATGDNVVVKQLQTEKETKSGIIVPQKNIHQAKILSMGPECPTDQITVGDRVVYGVYTGANIKVYGEEYLVMKYNDIMGKIE